MLQRYAHLSSEHLAEALEKIQPQTNFTPLFTPVGKWREIGKFIELLVRKGGLEPPWPCVTARTLNLVRLPIPPLPR